VSAEKYLVREKGQYIQLFNPPFDKSSMNPGYIKGYVPGVRENGGQYTHAAIWLVMAFAARKDREQTWKLLQMINPLNHGNTNDAIELYKVEPYIMAADIYGGEQHRGRGGWTWYAGSAGWMYQLILESFIGLKREGNLLTFEPCIPEDWKSFKIKYNYLETTYHIRIQQDEDEVEEVTMDGATLPNGIILLVDDKQEHEVVIKSKSFASLSVIS
jgi:cellobiose phosphorylase